MPFCMVSIFPVGGKGGEDGGGRVFGAIREEVRVDVQRDLYGGVTGEVLDRLDVGTGEKKLCYIRVPQDVRRDVEVQAGGGVPIRDLVTGCELSRDLLPCPVACVCDRLDLLLRDGFPGVAERGLCVSAAVGPMADVITDMIESTEMSRENRRDRNLSV